MKNELAEEIKKRTISAASWTPIIVSIAATILITLLLGLLDWDFSKILTAQYWVETSTTAFVGMAIYTYSYFNFIRKEKSIDGTVYSVVSKEHYTNQKYIIENNLREKLEEVVKEQNEKEKRFAISKVLAKYGLTYNDFETLQKSEDLRLELEAIAAKRKFSKKKKRRFIKDFDRCLYDEVKYNIIYTDELLNDIDAETDVIEFNQTKESKVYHEADIITKAIVSIVLSAVFNALIFNHFDKKFVEILIRNASVIFTNCLTASMKAKKYINYRRVILQNRNNIFSRVK